ncbi:MAG: hypothetical protein HOO96_06835 [Polyangiaceae bacterium]|nr:hypothetical protein [Polyangiaceae bacterium]
MHAIPVIPENERPALYIPPRDRYAGTTEIGDPLGALYASLRARIERYRRFCELDAAEVLLDLEACELQRVVDGLAAAAAQPLDVTTLDGWGRCSPPRPVPLSYRGDEPDPDDDTPPTAVWLAADTVVVARAGVAHVISLAERRVVRTLAIGAVRLQACDDAGRIVVVTGNSAFFSDNTCERFGCIDAETGDWLDEVPEDLPAVSFGRNEPEDGWLYEHRRAAAFAITGDRPMALCFARGNRALLASSTCYDFADHGIRSTSTCVEEVSAAVLERRRDAPCSVLLADGTLTDEPADDSAMADRWEPRMYEARPAAIAQVAGRWRFLLPSLHIAEFDRTFVQLGFAIDAASFSPDGARLLLVGDDLAVLDVSDVAFSWRASFDELGIEIR